jgi:hypothetical protein
MTTFTTEDRENANNSPPHIVDGGASVKSLSEYIEVEKRFEAYREQLQIMQAEIQRLRTRLRAHGENP